MKKQQHEVSSAKPSGSKIMPCTCKHEYQNSRYGSGMRVHALGGSKNAVTGSCTVCGSTKSKV